MLRVSIFVLSFCVFFSKALSAENYCSADLCPKGKPHIACGNTGQFSPQCPKNAKMVSLTPFKDKILELHNSKRNLIAGGGLPGYKSANRMVTMRWDDELAAMAAYNVKQCVMLHDKCRNTRTYKTSGQNLASITYNGLETSKSDASLVENRVNAWWNEYKNCNMKMIEKYPENHTGPDIGHFTVFVNEKNNRVGCAAIRYTNGDKHTFLLACNYATTNIYNKPSYNAGSTGQNCVTGQSLTYTNLCSVDEVYE